MSENPNLQEKIATRFASMADKVARQMAERIGTPTDSQEISLGEELRLWNDSPHGTDPQAIHDAASKLLMQNMPIDQIMDNIYPNRRKMMMQGRPNPEEWVKYSEKMKQHTESGEYDDAMELPNVKGTSGLSINPY